MRSCGEMPKGKSDDDVWGERRTTPVEWGKMREKGFSILFLVFGRTVLGRRLLGGEGREGRGGQ